MAVIAWSLVAWPCMAQALRDPMQPPAFAISIPDEKPAEAPAAGRVLQSTLLSGGRRIAMIDGKAFTVGDRIGEARIVAIESDSVTLREANKTFVLELYRGVQVIRRPEAGPLRKSSGGNER